MAPLSLVDPCDADAVWRDRVRHESGHALGAVMLGFSFGAVQMDRWGDYGEWGSVDGIRRTRTWPVFDDVLAEFEAFEREMYRDALDRSIVARLGVWTTLGEDWNGRGAAGDIEMVEANRPSEYSPGVWEVVVESAAHRLVRRDGFWIAHAAVVHELEREGRLTYEQVAELVTGSVCDEVA